jgi:acyl-CoA reductase-like NAD-dependent aldehyde dehydrogenase
VASPRLYALCALLSVECSDADLKLAASNIIKGGFSYSGQRCTAVKVVLVMEDVADELVKMVSGAFRG